MGLDMHLYGDVFFASSQGKRTKIEGFELSNQKFQIGYWRKQPDLHGYIVKEFADGKDECQDIWLSKENIEKIISAVRGDKLATGTEGFFFGKHDYSEEEKQRTLKIFSEALRFLEVMPSKEKWCDIHYSASW